MGCDNSARPLISLVFQTWRREGVRFLILRNYESLPELTGFDIDVLVLPEDFTKAQMILTQCAISKDWELLWFVEFACLAMWFRHRTAGEMLHFDLFNNLNCRGIETLATTEVLKRRKQGPLFDVPHSVDEAMINLLKGLLLAGSIKEKYKAGISKTRKAFPMQFEKTLSAIVGEDTARFIGSALENGDWEAIESSAMRIRVATLRMNLRYKPLTLFRNLLNDFRRLSTRFISPPIGIVAIVGPDGVGKTQTIEMIDDWFSRSLLACKKRHWRPGVIPLLGQLFGKSSFATNGPFPPRREAGHFHLVRLAYYFPDFVIGHLVFDRLYTSRARLVLYDRCALDMAVDPVRYGLPSAWGARLLWRLIPKPDVIVLLYDSPERIFARKPELAVEEISRQLGTWLQLAGEGEVDAVVYIDASPEEIAERVNGLILESFSRKKDALSKLNNSHQEITQFRRLSSTTKSGRRELVALEEQGAKTTSPPRFAQFSVRDGRRFLLPLNSRRAAVQGLELYPAQNKKAQLAKRVLSVGLRLGIAQRLMPQVAYVADPAIGGVEVTSSLLDHLRTIVGRAELAFSISLGTPGPNRKPVIQVSSQRGEILAYAKVGQKKQTLSLVRNEYMALKALGSLPFQAGKFASLIHFEEWEDKALLVTKPVGAGLRSSAFTHLHLRFLLEIAQISPQRGPFSTSPLWLSLAQRLSALKSDVPSYQFSILSKTMDFLESRLAAVVFPYPWKLGDFTPWNMTVDRQQEVINVFDIEYAAPDSIPGWDLFHFFSQTGKDGLGYQSRLEPYRPLFKEYFENLEIDLDLVPYLYLVYSVDLFISWRETWIESQAAMPYSAVHWFRSRITRILLTMHGLKEAQL